MSESSSQATITPPSGWVVNEKRFLRNYYWTNDRNSLRGVLLTHYGLENADPVWIRERTFGSIEFIFKAQPKDENQRQMLYYYYDGLSDIVLQFEEMSLNRIKADIELHGEKKGYLTRIKLKNVDENSLETKPGPASSRRLLGRALRDNV